MTLSKVAELRQAHAFLRSFNTVFDALRSRNAVRLLRLQARPPEACVLHRRRRPACRREARLSQAGWLVT